MTAPTATGVQAHPASWWYGGGVDWRRMATKGGHEWRRMASMDTQRTLTWKSPWCLGCLLPAHRSLILGGAGLLLLPVSVFFAPLPGLFLPLPSQFGLFCSSLRGAFELLQLGFICHPEVSACSPTALLQTPPLSLPPSFPHHPKACFTPSSSSHGCSHTVGQCFTPSIVAHTCTHSTHLHTFKQTHKDTHMCCGCVCECVRVCVGECV